MDFVGRFVAILGTGLAADPRRAVDREGYDRVVAPFFQQYCGTCHQGDSAESEFLLDAASLTADSTMATPQQRWREVVNVLNSHEMPPPKNPHSRKWRKLRGLSMGSHGKAFKPNWRARRDEQDQKNPNGKRFTQQQFERDLEHYRGDRMYDYGPPRAKLVVQLGSQPRTIAELDVPGTIEQPRTHEFTTRFATETA